MVMVVSGTQTLQLYTQDCYEPYLKFTRNTPNYIRKKSVVKLYVLEVQMLRRGRLHKMLPERAFTMEWQGLKSSLLWKLPMPSSARHLRRYRAQVQSFIAALANEVCGLQSQRHRGHNSSFWPLGCFWDFASRLSNGLMRLVAGYEILYGDTN